MTLGTAKGLALLTSPVHQENASHFKYVVLFIGLWVTASFNLTSHSASGCPTTDNWSFERQDRLSFIVHLLPFLNEFLSPMICLDN